MSLSKRASALDIASALAGGVFFALSVFFLLGAAVWAVLSLAQAPAAAIGAGEAFAGLAALVIAGLVVRNALRLAGSEAV
ncbi:MAG: hypothetical protein ACLFQ5_08740 [Oceanicaulis sp.]